jgi:crotonobetainyl-CoA:carnitine CoA-transferase CaiB-like acyl-CoA transferase
MTTSASPLSGLKVLDFSTLLPGPLASLMLAEAGADVTKIERPGLGDEMRHFEPKLGATGVMFALLNRGKKSLTLDLKDPAGKAQAFKLAAEADILIDQFRPGVMARLGLDYDSVAAANQKVIYCAITGYGQTGPNIDGVGHDLNYVAEAGLLSLVADKDGAPPLPGITLADIAGGTYPAIINILLALRERDVTGRGRYLDISMSDNMFPFMWRAQASVAVGDDVVANEDMLAGSSPRYGLYRTRDNKFIAAAPIEDRFWNNFCNALGLPLTASRADVEQTFAQQDAASWLQTFAGKDVCCSLVLSAGEAMSDARVQARGLFKRVVVSDGHEMAALPLPLVEAYRDPNLKAVSPPLS